jgi:hypothetical protein
MERNVEMAQILRITGICKTPFEAIYKAKSLALNNKNRFFRIR